LIEEIYDFTKLFGANLSLDEDPVLKKRDRYFFIDNALEKLPGNFVYAGVFLGKTVKSKFSPGFELLRMIAGTEANRVVVDGRTEWLFVCGRDIFKQGIIRILGSGRKGDHVLVMNDHLECLGYGIIVVDLDKVQRGLAVQNILDVGDFLRREEEE